MSNVTTECWMCLEGFDASEMTQRTLVQSGRVKSFCPCCNDREEADRGTPGLMSFTDAAHVAESIAVAGVESGKANTAIVLDLRHGPHTRSIDICDAMDIVRAARSAAPAVVTFSKVIRGTYRATVGVYEITVENMGDCWASTIHRNAKMVDTFFKGTRSDAERAALAKVAR